jgi:hypothetical protein
MLDAAIRELDTMVTGLIPPGKSGVLATIFDERGIRLGVAVKHGDDFAAGFEVRKAVKGGVSVRGVAEISW